jgi:hypothetical protein
MEVAFCLEVPELFQWRKLMYTSVVVMALSGFLAPSAVKSPSWFSDYGTAQELGREKGKPVAVFIGAGKDGWSKLSRDGNLGSKTTQILADDYICVYIDTNQDHGKRLAKDFEIPDGLGLILSDRTGKHQAFRHEGNLSRAALSHYLKQFADPELVVRYTQTNPMERTSYYSPAPSPPPTYYYNQPPVFYPSSFGVSRGSC